MPIFYHLNHGFLNCTPGEVFALAPIQAAVDDPNAELWRDRFPDGLSMFGLRHAIPNSPYGPMPEDKARLEMECEVVRRSGFGHLISRFQAFFALETPEEAMSFRANLNNRGAIWRVEASGISHRGDMNLLHPGTTTKAEIERYWLGRSGSVFPVWECVLPLPVTMLECVVPFD